MSELAEPLCVLSDAVRNHSDHSDAPRDGGAAAVLLEAYAIDIENEAELRRLIDASDPNSSRYCSGCTAIFGQCADSLPPRTDRGCLSDDALAGPTL